jgi:deoxycytidylate deaminase
MNDYPTLTDTTAMKAWPNFPSPGAAELESRLKALRSVAQRGPCAKSKRAAMLLADNAFGVGFNAPAGEGQCTADAACRAACASICNHAEEAAILSGLCNVPLSTKEKRCYIPHAHVIHLAVDAEGRPRSKPTPSCITCSRLMVAVGVEAVWLWGLQDIPPMDTALGRWLVADDDRLARFRAAAAAAALHVKFIDCAVGVPLTAGLQAAVGLPSINGAHDLPGPLGKAISFLLDQQVVREDESLRYALLEAESRVLGVIQQDLKNALLGEPRWRGWPMAEFHEATLRNLGLPVSSRAIP